ncbi:hypothetical protein DB797_24120, partial [Xanthomonas perforans]
MGNVLTAACGIARVHRGWLPDRCGPAGGARCRLIHRIGIAHVQACAFAGSPAAVPYRPVRCRRDASA